MQTAALPDISTEGTRGAFFAYFWRKMADRAGWGTQGSRVDTPLDAPIECLP